MGCIITYLDRIKVQEALPSASRNQTECHHVLAQLVGYKHRSFGIVLFGLVHESSLNKSRATFTRGSRHANVLDDVFVEILGRYGHELTAVTPETDADASCMRGCEEFSGGGHGERSAGTGHAEDVNEMPGWQVPYSNHGVHGGSDDPAAIIGEDEVIHLADASPEFTDKLPGLEIDDAD